VFNIAGDSGCNRSHSERLFGCETSTWHGTETRTQLVLTTSTIPVGQEQGNKLGASWRREARERRIISTFEKPFIGNLRVTNPVRQSRASPGAPGEASLAWGGRPSSGAPHGIIEGQRGYQRVGLRCYRGAVDRRHSSAAPEFRRGRQTRRYVCPWTFADLGPGAPYVIIRGWSDYSRDAFEPTDQLLNAGGWRGYPDSVGSIRSEGVYFREFSQTDERTHMAHR
jgi:hypothetical protein